jgi:hypothetical protein
MGFWPVSYGPKAQGPEPAGSPPLPDPLNTVAPEDWIGGHDCQSFLEGLRGEQAIEWIAVMEWQAGHPRDMVDVDPKFTKTVRRELFGDEPFDTSGNFELAETRLDGEFPATRDAHEALALRMRNRLSSFRGHLWSVGYPPEEGVGVEQEAHYT